MSSNDLRSTCSHLRSRLHVAGDKGWGARDAGGSPWTCVSARSAVPRPRRHAPFTRNGVLTYVHHQQAAAHACGHGRHRGDRGPRARRLRCPRRRRRTGGSAAASSCVDTSGDTVKVGLLNSLSGTMAISEVTVRDSLHAGRSRRSTPPAACSARRSSRSSEDGASDWPTFAEKAEKLITQDKVAAVFGGWTSASRKAMLPVFERQQGAAVLPGAVRGPGGVAEHLLHRRDHQPADHPGPGLPQGARA